MNLSLNRKYGYFLKEHLPVLQYLFKHIIQSYKSDVSFEDWCQLAFSTTNIEHEFLCYKRF